MAVSGATKTDRLVIARHELGGVAHLPRLLEDVARLTWVTRYGTSALQSLAFVRPRPMDLSLFEVEPRNGITAWCQGEPGDWIDSVAAFASDRIGELRTARIVYHLRPSGLECRLASVDCLTISGGHRAGGYYVGIKIHHARSAWSDLDSRRRVFDHFFCQIGVDAVVTTGMDCGALIIINDAPESWTIGYLASQAPGNRSPFAFDVRGFQDFSSMRCAMERAVAYFGAELGVDELSFSAKCDEETYTRLRGAFPDIGLGWGCEFYGRPVGPIEELCSRADWNLPVRIPIFEWDEGEDRPFFQADATNGEKGPCIEIVSNCGDMEYLRKAVSNLGGIAGVTL